MHRAIRRLAILGLLGLIAVTAEASSHREAPAITERPKVDGTDLYAFRSYEPGRENFVTIIANYQPLQDSYGGPNYFSMDPDALYEIHVDRNGDSLEDITFQFQFQNTIQDIQIPVGLPGQEVMVSIPLINAGPILAGSTGAQNVVETYTLDVVMGDRRTGVRMPVAQAGTTTTTFGKPIDYIGIKSLPDYEAYADTFMYDIDLPGSSTPGRVFVGQRREGFAVNLGEVFDLVNLNPLGPPDGETNVIGNKNVTSIAIEVPIESLTASGAPGDPFEPVIGVWTTASLRQGRVLNPLPEAALGEKDSIHGGAWTQVSRLGSPLVNEVVIGLKDKDKFNASEPKDDAQFATYVTNPTLPELIQLLFGVNAPDLHPRADLVAGFLTGLPTLNQPENVVPAEMLRLNTEIPPTPAALQGRLGLIDADIAGFPNGRRPGDDVVDIALRVVMGVFVDPSVAPDGQLPYTDGAFVDSSFFLTEFPYLMTPVPGSPFTTP